MTPLSPPLPKSNDTTLRWGQLNGNSSALAISELATKSNSPILLIAPDVHTSTQWQDALRFFLGDQFPILLFPDWETLPYDHFSPHQDLVSDRLLTLYQLPRLKKGIVISAVTTLMHRLCPSDYIENNTFILTTKQAFPLEQNRARFIQAGYRHVEQVMEHGEFAVRGSILDIFPMGSKSPYRVELFDDDVDSIRQFDPDTQRSSEKLEAVRMLPAREFPLTDSAITHFRQSWRERFSGNPAESVIYQQISHGELYPGIDYYLPLFFDRTETLLDYVPKNTLVVSLPNVDESARQFWEEVKYRYEQLRHDLQKPLCAPSDLFIPIESVRESIKKHTQINLDTEHLTEKQNHINFNTDKLPNLQIDHKSKTPLKAVKQFVKSFQGRILFCAESAGRRETLIEIFHDATITLHPCDGWPSFLASSSPYPIAIAHLTQGFQIDDPAIAIITESELFGEEVHQTKTRDDYRPDPNALIRNLTELRIGDPIVHLQHGVGRYLGLETIKTNDHEGEYLMLGYADGDKIYVPVFSLHLIHRYTGADSEHAPIQKLGSKQWEKIKSNAFKRVRDVAAELLDVYGRRQDAKGFAFKLPEKEFQQFSQSFPFEETPDQFAAIQDVIKDMTSEKIMDRLICGDVGFGKTEVAMRAVFLAIQNNKQAAILVPTTLLAEQHLHNFQDRFAEWAVRVAALSRLHSSKQNQEALDHLSQGKIDVIIGTHKLLSTDVKFKNLGLLIIDEEHRFGVRQKERIKALRAHVDILTLTATPIPRTLNMAMAGIRDLSIIATPPARRLSIKTFIQEYNPPLIREAILRESMRGGQVYFLHNEIATIQAMTEKLKKSLPEARIAIAHGQMRERELERIMLDFYHQKFNVLVCSTIIESGIDIPSANTIIINRADKFGLAQLHQLRGRVGRSHHQAYAYLITPPWKALNSDAQKRLEAISQLDELGVGFNLSTHDLEIRGAGELLGMEQSGHIQTIGFSLYLELLEEAVASLKAGKEPALERPLHIGTEVDLGISTLLPANYVSDVHARLTLYKRLANCVDAQAIQALKEELIDRFGPLPLETKYLLRSTRIHQQANTLGINKITAGAQSGHVFFESNPKFDLSRLIKLIQTQPERYQLHADHLRFKISHPDPDARLKAVELLLQEIG